MKEIKRKRQSTITYYQCDVCKKEHYSALEAINCEKSHTCKHKPVFKFTEASEASENSWWFNVCGITSVCKFCEKKLGDVYFEDIEDNQNIMKAIYSLIKEHNQSLELTGEGRNASDMPE